MLIGVETLIEEIGEAYVEIDADFRILGMNENAETLLRTSRIEAVGRALGETIADANNSQHWPAFVAAVKAGVAQTLSVFYPVQYKWHEVKIIPLPEGQTGLLMRDVTNRQWLIRREAERTYLKNLFESAPVAILLLRGRDLEVEYMNELAGRLTGNRQILGRPMRDAFSDIEQQELFDVVERVFREGTPFSSRDVYVRYDRDNDGELEDGYFDVTYQPVGDFDGTISGVLSLSIEVTDRIRETTDSSRTPADRVHPEQLGAEPV